MVEEADGMLRGAETSQVPPAPDRISTRYLLCPFLAFQVVLSSLQIMHQAPQPPGVADTSNTSGRSRMEFEDVLAQTIALLQHQGRISYGALKRRFQLDDAYLEDLKVELIEAQHLARDENGRILVWAGGTAPTPPAVPAPTVSAAQIASQAEVPSIDRRAPDAER